MWQYAAAALCLSLAGCSGATIGHSPDPPVHTYVPTGPDPATVKAERDAADKKCIACLMRAVVALDDNKSDPATIAQGAMSACGTELDEQVYAYSRYLPDYVQGRQVVSAKAREAASGAAIQFVLQNRKGQLRLPR